MSDTVSRAWALKAQWVVLALATGFAGYLGYTHVVLTHGAATFESLCNLGGSFNCDAVNTSAWASLLGAPISAWALPLYAAMAYLAWRGHRADTRGAKARGALVALAGWNVLFSAFLAYVSIVDIGFLCLFCMTLYGLHAVSLVLALLPPGGRMPSLPATEDLAPAGAIAASVAAVAVGGSILWANRLDAAVVADIEQAMEGREIASELRSSGQIRLPTAPARDVAIASHTPTYGPPDAAVTVIEFADFECGYCRKLSFAMAEMKERYGDRVRFAFRHFPMDKECNDGVSRTHHPHACEAALAAQCAHQQGKFWEYHDTLFRNQKRLEDDDLRLYAEAVGLDVDAWSACMSDVSFRSFLLADIASAKALEISGTPRTYVNGREFRGAVSERILDAAIRVALGEAELDDVGRVESISEVVTEPPPPAGPIAMVPSRIGDRTFFIDAVEAHIDDAGIARAHVGADPTPASWFTAKAACEAAGKRLCTAEEWLATCQGMDPVDEDGDGNVFGDFVEGRLYPYGPRYQEGRCHEALDRDMGGPVPAARLPGCRTPTGVYDLAGNVQEWVGDSETTAQLVGGAWYYEDKANCSAHYDTFGPGYSNRSTGFRCCADTNVPDAPATPARQVDVPPVATASGEPVPEFSGPTPDGGTAGSETIRGKVALVNFWASWCGPCQRELPALKTLQADFADRGFTVLAVNVDKEPQAAERLLRRVDPNYPVIYDPESEVMGLFDVMAMPTSVLVGKDGRMITLHTGYSEAWIAELRTQIEGLLE